MLQSILVKSANDSPTGEIPADVTVILVVSTLVPSVLLVLVSVQVVLNELNFDPVGMGARKAQLRTSRVTSQVMVAVRSQSQRARPLPLIQDLPPTKEASRKRVSDKDKAVVV